MYISRLLEEIYLYDIRSHMSGPLQLISLEQFLHQLHENLMPTPRIIYSPSKLSLLTNFSYFS